MNRLSLGSQSFDDRVLEWMHRTHDASAIERAVATARAGGIHNLSLDLIFALPSELERDLERDVRRLAALEPDHVSLYGLTVESATPLGRWVARGDAVERPEEGYEAEFLTAHALLTSAGLEHYEVSNYALPGQALAAQLGVLDGRPVRRARARGARVRRRGSALERARLRGLARPRHGRHGPARRRGNADGCQPIRRVGVSRIAERSWPRPALRRA